MFSRFGVPSLFVTANTDPQTRGRAQAVHHRGDLGLGDHERRRDLEGVAAQDTRRHPVPERRHHRSLRQSRIGRQQVRAERREQGSRFPQLGFHQLS